MSMTPPECSKCCKTESVFWNRNDDGSIICIGCFEGGPSNVVSKDVEIDKNKNKESNEDNGPKIATRRSTRTTGTTKARTSYVMPKKGKGRRAIFKKTCMKAPAPVATVVTSDHVFYKGQLFKIGDIVNVIDADHKVYYCQLRGFMIDQYSEKSAVVTWLFPTNKSPPPELGFDPTTYFIGLEEDTPRKMECFEFVAHASSDYFKSYNSPYPPVNYDLLTKSKGVSSLFNGD